MQINLKRLFLIFVLCYSVVFTSSLQVFADEISLYPIDVNYEVQNGFNIITKTYALSSSDDPSKIPKENFTQYDEEYILSDITKKEITEDDSMEHIETVTINTTANDLNTILAELEDTLEYDEDGYTGVLKLDINSIQSEVSGYSNNSYTSTRTREYPNFSNQDTSLVPKTITDGGITYNLQTVNFKSSNTNSIDSTEIATSYTAVATYTTKVSSKSVKGYTTTANYIGTINKTVANKILYTATFIGNPSTDIDSTEQIENSIVEIEKTKSSFNFSSLIPVLKTLIILIFTGGIAYLIYFIMFYQNITIFNQNGLEYKKVGKLHLNTKNPKLVINLNNIAVSKIKSGNFVVELSSGIIKLLKDKSLYTIFKDCENVHTLRSDIESGKYQFESNFEQINLEDYNNEENYIFENEYKDNEE